MDWRATWSTGSNSRIGIGECVCTCVLVCVCIHSYVCACSVCAYCPTVPSRFERDSPALGGYCPASCTNLDRDAVCPAFKENLVIASVSEPRSAEFSLQNYLYII